jgi:hypothetical protein
MSTGVHCCRYLSAQIRLSFYAWAGNDSGSSHQQHSMDRRIGIASFGCPGQQVDSWRPVTSAALLGGESRKSVPHPFMETCRSVSTWGLATSQTRGPPPQLRPEVAPKSDVQASVGHKTLPRCCYCGLQCRWNAQHYRAVGGVGMGLTGQCRGGIAARNTAECSGRSR